jgi:3-isopropylmalate/(R)-2-methylmalate dehydratase small subunit
MEPFTRMTAVAAPLIRANVDTDAIIPSREMKTVSRTGLAEGLFAGWRYKEIGSREPDPGFVLNQPAYAQARILLGGENFGCGSSREHAVWALAEYGIRAIVAPSFSPIFYNNCVRNGVLPVRLPAATIAMLAEEVAADPPARPLTIDLQARELRAPDGSVHRFEIEAEARDMLLEGLDAIDLTMKHRSAIEEFWRADRAARPWIYLDPPGGGTP